MKNAAKKLKNPIVLRFIAGIVLILILVGGFLLWQTKRDRIFVDDSMITASVITVSPEKSGELKEMDAAEGKTLKKGDIIALIGDETIRSTTDALVLTTNNQVGGTVTPQTQLVQLIDPSQIRIVGTLDENKGLDKIHVGQVVAFTVDAYPGEKFWGYVDGISQTAKQTQASFSISSERPTQQFQIFARFNSTKYPELKNGIVIFGE